MAPPVGNTEPAQRPHPQKIPLHSPILKVFLWRLTPREEKGVPPGPLLPAGTKAAAAITLAYFWRATPTPALPDNYIGADQGLWSDPNNWSAGVPNNSTFDVTINNAAPITVQLDASETIDTLSLAAPDALSILAAKTLTLAGNSLVNTGTINLPRLR